MLTFSTISLVLVMNMYLTQLLLLSYEPRHPNKTLELLANQQIAITFMDKMNVSLRFSIFCFLLYALQSWHALDE